MPSTKAQTRQVTDGPGGVVLTEVPAELPPQLPQRVVLFIRFCTPRAFTHGSIGPAASAGPGADHLRRVDPDRGVRRDLRQCHDRPGAARDAVLRPYETPFTSLITAGDLLSDWLAARRGTQAEAVGGFVEQVEEGRHPRTNATVGPVLDEHL